MKRRMSIELNGNNATVSFYEDEKLVVGASANKDDESPVSSALYFAVLTMSDQQDHIAHLKSKIESLEKTIISGDRIIHDTTVGMQAAVIAADHHGAERGMVWIRNKLHGPGMLPDEDDPHYHCAQAFYDYHCYDAEIERREAK